MDVKTRKEKAGQNKTMGCEDRLTSRHGIVTVLLLFRHQCGRLLFSLFVACVSSASAHHALLRLIGRLHDLQNLAAGTRVSDTRIDQDVDFTSIILTEAL